MRMVNVCILMIYIICVHPKRMSPYVSETIFELLNYLQNCIAQNCIAYAVRGPTFLCSPFFKNLSAFAIVFCLFRTWAEHSQGHPVSMRGFLTAAVMGCMGPTVLTLASLCLQKSHKCWISACFRTPRLSLGHPGSFKSAHGLKCMLTQTAPLFNVPL